MSLDDCYNANAGKALLIPGGGAGNEGQCVQWADTVLHDVYGFDYHWGNAIDWWKTPGELLNHFDKVTDGTVKKGDFVIFNTQVGSVYGHIDVAAADGTISGFTGWDSNWGGNKTVHVVQHSNPNFVLGSLRLKGENTVMITKEDEMVLAQLATGSNPGADYNYQFTGTDSWDSCLNFWLGQSQLPNLQNEVNDLKSKLAAVAPPTTSTTATTGNTPPVVVPVTAQPPTPADQEKVNIFVALWRALFG